MDCTSDLNAIIYCLHEYHSFNSEYVSRFRDLSSDSLCEGGRVCAGLGGKQEKRREGRTSISVFALDKSV